MDRGSIYKNLTVLSVEQALALPYCTYRLAQEGMRVIRLEAPPKGDPNRYVGINLLGEEGMDSYYLPVNGGKESITLNLKTDEGRGVLYDLIERLRVDMFTTNQMPQNYPSLGIGYDAIRSVRQNIIWLGLTGYGPRMFEPAYDPVVQARAGLMELNGEPERDPMNIGVPVVDIGAGETAYGQIMKALLERQITGKGKRIDISLFDSAISWTATHLPVSMTCNIEVSRRGNTHQFFAPVSLFKTRDGYVYLGVGTDRQWQTLVGLNDFKHLDEPQYETNSGRMADGARLIAEIEKVVAGKTSREVLEQVKGVGLVVGATRSLKQIETDPLVQQRLIKAKDPKTNTEVVLGSPPLETAFLRSAGYRLSFPPRLGEHNRGILEKELGYSPEKVAELENRKIL
jgi:formyl-CoA transferase